MIDPSSSMLATMASSGSCSGSMRPTRSASIGAASERRPRAFLSRFPLLTVSATRRSAVGSRRADFSAASSSGEMSRAGADIQVGRRLQGSPRLGSFLYGSGYRLTSGRRLELERTAAAEREVRELRKPFEHLGKLEDTEGVDRCVHPVIIAVVGRLIWRPSR